jgi:hypothetical protein
MADKKAGNRVAYVEFKNFLKLEADSVHNDGKALLTPEQARALASKLTQLSEAAESKCQTDPCVVLELNEARRGMPTLHERGKGIYVAAGTFSAEPDEPA